MTVFDLMKDFISWRRAARRGEIQSHMNMQCYLPAAPMWSTSAWRNIATGVRRIRPFEIGEKRRAKKATDCENTTTQAEWP